jgi:hypothetical protein
MATKTDPAQAPPQGEGESKPPADDSKTPTMADVRKEIREEIEAALAPVKELLTGKGGSTADNSDPKSGQSGGSGVPDLGAMVDQALAKVLGDRDRQAADQAHAEQHRKIEAAAAESRPVDRPRRSKWLGAIYD